MDGAARTRVIMGAGGGTSRGALLGFAGGGIGGPNESKPSEGIGLTSGPVEGGKAVLVAGIGLVKVFVVRFVSTRSLVELADD